MPEPKRCPKCGSEMQEGLQVDFIGNTQVYAQRWISADDAAAAGIAAGKMSNLMPLSRFAEQLLAVKTYRCAACGYLESYA